MEKLINQIKKDKEILIFSIIMMACFSFYLYKKDKKEYEGVKLVDIKMGIDIHVNKTVLNRTELFLNDSLIIPSGLKIRSKKPSWLNKKSSSHDYVNYSLSDIPEPYKLYKLANSKDVFIVKNRDTLHFKFFGKDPNDPTFKDLFQKYIKK